MYKQNNGAKYKCNITFHFTLGIDNNPSIVCNCKENALSKIKSKAILQVHSY